MGRYELESMGKYEESWLKSLAKGEEVAYNRLFDCYYSSLVMFAHSYLKDVAGAEDLVQDVIYELWKSRADLVKVESLKAWLYASVRNRCIDKLEHDKVERRYLELNREGEADFFLQRIIEEEVYASLKQAIEHLPDRTREVYRLLLAGKSNGEVAFLLGLTEDAVKAYRKRGKKLLKEKLEGLWMYVSCCQMFLE